jgi:hypothetical protein
MRIPVRSGLDPDSPVLGVGGNLSGKLGFEKKSDLQIVASPVRIDILKNGQSGRILFDIDRYERALIFQNRWLSDYQRELTPVVLFSPEIKMVLEPIVQNGNPIRIQFQPINEPESARILLECAELKADSGDLQNYRTVTNFPTARQERFALKFDEKSGTFQFLNGMKDWSYEMPTTGLVGRISLKASLIDQSGKVVAVDMKEVLLDDQAVRMAEIINLPDFVKAGGKLKIQMQLVPPKSGIKKAIAILDSVKDKKIPENAIQVVMQREMPPKVSEGNSAQSLEIWSGLVEVPVKSELIGRRPFTIIFETGSGLTGEISSFIQIMAADFVEPGAIKGAVVQGSLPQADLPVVLRKMDAKRTEIKRTKTDRMGQFQISGIAPGTYGLFTAKTTDQTSAEAEVVVTSGQLTQLQLGLGRVNLPSNGPAPKAEKSEAGK